MDGVDSMQKGLQMFFRGSKMVALILFSTIYRTFSLVIMAILIREYTVLPILMMIIVQSFLAKKIVGKPGSTGDFLLTFIPYGVMTLISGPILPPGKSESNQDLPETRFKRKRWFFYDSIVTFLIYGLTLVIIGLIWWWSPILLEKNLNGCFIGVITGRVKGFDNVIIICGSLLGIGILHLMLSAIHFQWGIGF